MRQFATAAAAIICSVSCAHPPRVPDVYTSTRNNAGHEFVKTEDFVVPRGTVIQIKGLRFGAECVLTPDTKRIVTQVFNSLEEITENTVNDPDRARVAEHKAMTFEIRGRCSRAVMDFLTYLGTPVWRLEAKETGPDVVFVRTK
jgi:hypothetical protein